MTESSVCLQKPNSFENVISHHSLLDFQETLFRHNGHHFHTLSGDKDPVIGPDSNDPKQCLPLLDPSYGENVSRFRHHCLDSNDVQQQHGHFHQESEDLEKLVSSNSLTSFPKSALRYETSHLSFNGIKTSVAPRNKTKVCSVLVTRLSKKLLSKARVRVSKRDFKNLFGNTHKSNKETLHQNHTNDFRRTVKKRLKHEEQRKNRERTIRDWQPDIGYEVMQQASPLLSQLPPESAFVSNVNSYQRTDSGSYSIDGSLNLVSSRTFEEQQMSAMRGPLDASSFGATGETLDCSSRLCFKDESALTSGMKRNCPNSEALNLKRPLPVTFDTDELQDDCDKSVDCVKLSSDVFDTRESNNSYPSGKAYSPSHYNDALRQQNDSESENFTSVFTKSMTSLYSQDSDNTFLSETNLTGDISNMDDKSGDDKEEKRKLEMMKAKVGNDESVDHQSFSISGHMEETNGFAEVNGAGKNQDLQSGYMFPSDSDMVDNRNVLKIQNELGVKEDRLSCYNYDRFSGDEPYIGTQNDGNNNRGTCDINQNDIPEITSECVNEKFADNVSVPGLILLKSAAEWEQSNSNDNSKCGDKKMSKQSNHRLFMERGFAAEEAYPNSNPDKHLTNLDRNTGSDGEYVEEEIKYCFKKPQKISALSVYTKVASDVITDVKCKRFKKRTKSCNTEYSTEPYTQEVLPNFCVSNTLINANRPLKIPEDPQDLLRQTVKLVLDDLTDKVSEMCGDKMSSDDLTLMDANKTKELIFKFCTKYLMDYRDFQDIEKVLEVRVISSTDEMHPRRRKRQRLGKRKKDVENFSGESLEDGSRKDGENNKSQEDTNGEYRVLRSLPGRISQRHLRKAANKRFLKRYSTRNTARYNQELFNEVQDQHERQEQERYEHSKNDKMDFSSSEDSFLRHEQTEKVLKDQGENNFQLRLEDTDDEEMPSFRSNEMEGSVITLSDDTEDSVIVRTKDRSMSSGSNEMPPLSNAYDTFSSPELTKPPQLVRMEDTTKLFEEEAHKDCDTNRSIENERFSPSYLTANTANPSPITTTPGVIKNSSYSDGNREDVLHSFDADDTDDGELVIDMDSQDTGSPASVENKGCSSSPCSISNTLDSTDSATTGSKKELQSQFLNKLHESHAQQASSEDDCIVITNEETTTPLKKEPKDVEAREPSTESFQMLDNSTIDKDARSEISSPLKQATTLKEAQDQDESILRTLLLDSTENVVNPTLSPEGTSQTPVISNVISLNGVKSLSPSPPALHEAISKHSISPDHNASPIPSLDDEKSPSKTPEILKPTLFPLHYGGGQCISPNPGAAPRFDTKAEVQPPPKEKAPSSVSPQPKSTESKEGPWIQDPRHLKDKIKKLKNEIVYLQLMAEQKEKERIAIICFKRYKEEILRRIYKAYAVTVEDHVRDMFHTHKKDTNEYSHHQEHHSPSPTHPPHRQSQQPTFSPSPCDVIRPPYMRSFSENNHNAHEKHLRTILPKPAPAHMQNTPSYHSSIHQKGTCPVKPMSSHDGRTPAYGEKLPAVEAMVAKATENYGVDMRNLRDGLPARRILPKESISSTILQKVLASKEGAARSATGENFSGVPLWPVHLEQAFRNNSNSNSNNHNNNNQNNSSHNNSSSHNNNNNVKSISGSPIVSKRYTPEYIPLDMIINQSSRNAESDRGLAKPQEFYRGSPESVLASHLAHSYGAKETSQIQALLSNSDPTPSKSAPSTFTSWSTQSGGRINDSHVNGNRIASSSGNSTSAARSLGALASVSQRQINPRASPQKTAGMMFAVPPPVKSSSIQNNATSHHSHSENRESSKGNLEKMYVRKTEEGRPVMYSSLMSPNSTMPYGGHIIRNEASGSSSSTTTTTSTTAPNNCPRCMGCGLSDAKYLCSGCRKHWYCSPQCQTLRWPEHSRVCAGRIYAQAPGTYS